MSKSDEVRRKLAELAKKRAALETEIGKAEKRKSDKEAEVASRSARASSTKSDSSRRTYLRQAETARNAALGEQKKLASLASKRADLSKQEAAGNRDLNSAIQRENTLAARQVDKDRRDAETARRADERQRQQDRLEQQRHRAAVANQITQSEGRLGAQIAAIREPKAEPLRILYGTATPDGELRVSQEIRRVEAAVRAAVHRDQVSIRHAPDITSGDLLDYVTSFQPHVVHFSGHANAEELFFDDGSMEGGYQSVPIQYFMDALSAADEPPQLVVLNACKSAENLQPLLARVPMAVGMSASVGDPDAITFATRFYRALADGQSVQGALSLASADMKMNGLDDYDLPTIVAADDIDPATVRLVVNDRSERE
ncbi:MULTISPECIES: CHAT domain-containing protein [unclassified Frondihabitans]|uniref:CHAT domain-containing protein n=1 Tax=unclassified Frondihabitans TaxID=2626248 RepID=UPI001315627D|nr:MULTISPECIES: CHAT domain-containing protein [unclassified Frondihabitans]